MKSLPYGSFLLFVTRLLNTVVGNCLSSKGITFKEYPTMYLDKSPYSILRIMHSFECLLACENDNRCHSLNIIRKSEDHINCELLSGNKTASKIIASDISTHHKVIATAKETADAKAMVFCKPECRYVASCKEDPAESCRCLDGMMLSMHHPSLVQVGASGGSYAKVMVDIPTGKYKLKLVSVAGAISCAGMDFKNLNNFGCITPGRDEIMMVVTDKNDATLLPGKNGYSHDGNSSNSAFLTFNDPIHLTHGQEIRIWYKEDLENAGEGDNFGRSYMKVLALRQDE